MNPNTIDTMSKYPGNKVWSIKSKSGIIFLYISKFLL